MPKKVSVEYFIQLSQRVNTLHKGKGKIYWSPNKKGQGVIVNPGQRQGYSSITCILTSPGQ